MTSPFGDLNATTPPPDAPTSRRRGQRKDPREATPPVESTSLPSSTSPTDLLGIDRDSNRLESTRRRPVELGAEGRSPRIALGTYQRTVVESHSDDDDHGRLGLLEECAINQRLIEDGVRRDMEADATRRRVRTKSSSTGDRMLDRIAIGHGSLVPGRRATIAQSARDDIFKDGRFMQLRKIGRSKAASASSATLHELRMKLTFVSELTDGEALYVPPRDMASLMEYSQSNPMTMTQAHGLEYSWRTPITIFFSKPWFVPEQADVATPENADLSDDYRVGRWTGVLQDTVPIPRSIHETQVQLRRLSFDEAFFARARIGVEAHLEAMTIFFEQGKPDPKVMSWVALQDRENPKAPPLHGGIWTDVTGSALESICARAVACLATPPEHSTPDVERGSAPDKPARENEEVGEEAQDRSDEETSLVKTLRFSKTSGRGHVVGSGKGSEKSGHERRATTGIRYKRLTPDGPLVPVKVPIKEATVKGGPPEGQVTVRQGFPTRPEDVVVPGEMETTSSIPSENNDDQALGQGRGSGKPAPAPRRRLSLDTATSRQSPVRSTETDAPSVIATRSAETMDEMSHRHATEATSDSPEMHGGEHTDTSHEGPGL